MPIDADTWKGGEQQITRNSREGQAQTDGQERRDRRAELKDETCRGKRQSGRKHTERHARERERGERETGRRAPFRAAGHPNIITTQRGVVITSRQRKEERRERRQTRRDETNGASRAEQSRRQ